MICSVLFSQDACILHHQDCKWCQQHFQDDVEDPWELTMLERAVASVGQSTRATSRREDRKYYQRILRVNIFLLFSDGCDSCLTSPTSQLSCLSCLSCLITLSLCLSHLTYFPRLTLLCDRGQLFLGWRASIFSVRGRCFSSVTSISQKDSLTVLFTSTS